MPYNPKDVPLGWDGKPIPYWLYKLHGLNLYFTCEICGNATYRGPLAFQRHFTVLTLPSYFLLTSYFLLVTFKLVTLLLICYVVVTFHVTLLLNCYIVVTICIQLQSLLFQKLAYALAFSILWTLRFSFCYSLSIQH